MIQSSLIFLLLVTNIVLAADVAHAVWTKFYVISMYLCAKCFYLSGFICLPVQVVQKTK